MLTEGVLKTKKSLLPCFRPAIQEVITCNAGLRYCTCNEPKEDPRRWTFWGLFVQVAGVCRLGSSGWHMAADEPDLPLDKSQSNMHVNDVRRTIACGFLQSMHAQPKSCKLSRSFCLPSKRERAQVLDVKLNHCILPHFKLQLFVCVMVHVLQTFGIPSRPLLLSAVILSLSADSYVF